MLLSEIATRTQIQAIGAAIAPIWHYTSAHVSSDSSNATTVIQFRQQADAAARQGYNALDHKQLDDQLQNALHSAGIEYQQAGFKEIARNFNAQPLIAYVVVLTA